MPDAPTAIVKIDVEGSELEVLETMESLLVRDSPFVLIEVLPAYHAQNTVRIARQKSVEALVSRCGYTILRVMTDKRGHLEHLLLVEEFGIHGDLNQCDYVLTPAAWMSSISNLLR
jgi:hypothetical protein